MLSRVGLVVLTACGRIGFDPTAEATIEFHGTSTKIIEMTGGIGVSLAQPPGTIEGDVLVAILAMGSTGNPAMPGFTPPTGWTQIQRNDRANDSTLISYWHAASAAEPATYTWAFDATIEGVSWISAYGGVDVDDPIDASDGDVVTDTGPSYATPSIVTTDANSLVVAAYASHLASDNGQTTWVAPAGAASRADVNNGSTRSGLGIDLSEPAAGVVGPLTASASLAQEYALVQIVALHPR